MRIFGEAHYPFLKWRRAAYGISALAMLIGIGAMVYNVSSVGSWLNYGVDFSGGTLIHVDFQEQVQVEQIRSISNEWEITRFGEPEESEFTIRIPTFEESLEVDPADAVTDALSAEFGADRYQVVRTEAVGPRVGDELQQRALLAILVSFALTLVYLAFRFEWRFGVAAIVATAHDILITLGFLAVLQMEISVGTVAAFLTIVGYSLNDTIIVFDRIRENLAKRIRGEEYPDLVDRSINETLPRTVLTTGTTLTTLSALYFFGGSVISDFALVLILGIAIGTFSSIFVASPALAAIVNRWPRSDKKKAAKRSDRTSKRTPARV